MARGKITRRQKDISRLLREKSQIQREKLKALYKRRHVAVLISTALLFSAFLGCEKGASPHQQNSFKIAIPFGKTYNYEDILVTRVIDGDTIQLEDGERVRLIGIDTPEARDNLKLQRDMKRTGKDYTTIVAMGRRASAFTRSLVEGKRVRLEFDVERRDKYGRLLAYAYLSDGKMLNAEIVKEGYGQVYTFPPNVKYVDMFLKLQEEARTHNRGLWGESR